MPRYFYVVTCHECNKPITAEEITLAQYNVYAARGFQTNAESFGIDKELVNTVYEDVQDICSACIDATLVGDEESQ